jgi:hypothetical protein
MSEHVVTMYMPMRTEPRAERAYEDLGKALGDDVTVTRPDDTGTFEIHLDAPDQEQALHRIWNAIAAAGADDHIVFDEHADIPEHWRDRTR